MIRYPATRMLRRRGLIGVGLAAVALTLALPATTSAARLKRVVSGFSSLTQATAPQSGDRTGAVFAVEQQGRIWRRASGSLAVFLDIRGIVGTGGERGLLSIAFSPAYRTDRTFFVFYTNNRGDLRIARYRTNGKRTRARAGTRKIIFTAEHSQASNHNGGQLAFGPRGRLFASTGDGGGDCGSAGEVAQNRSSRLGKLWSINPRNRSAGWRLDGYGFRNPWRFSFDRVTNRLYLADVGQNTWEEIDTRRAGALGGRAENYGWDVYEARSPSGCIDADRRGSGPLVWPISRYSHSAGRCSITGGFAYRGRALRWLRGSYVFADYCTGEIWRIKVSRRGKLKVGRKLIVDSPHNITSFGENVRGEILVATSGGEVYKLARS